MPEKHNISAHMEKVKTLTWLENRKKNGLS